ncbi:MAG: hypothetical protein CSYNP_01596 [Syntrophus sp. SKADARSKE-3]|nr:hypothetical protein [Syntrophus sp. SKADARSKE-3]
MDTYDLKKLLFELRLTPQQAAFAEDYATYANPDKAVAIAGYQSKGKFAKQRAADLLNHEGILKYIKALRDNAFLRANLCLDDVIAEYKKMAFTNMADYVDWNNNRIIIKDKHELTVDQQAGVLEITETETKLGKTVSIKLHPKQAALDKLYKMMTEMDDRLAAKKPAGDPKLQINMNNVRVILGDSKQRKAVEQLAGAFLKYDLKITGAMQNAIDALTNQIEHKPEEISDGMAEKIEAERYGGDDATRGLLLEHGDESK